MKETFWIDGYNLLFYLSEANPLQKKREELLRELNELVEQANVEANVVFDAKEFSRTSFKALDVVYTPKGMSADDYILEHHSSKETGPSLRGEQRQILCREARILQAKVLSVKQFLQFIIKRVKKGTPPPKPPKTVIKDREFDRHAKIFEERLKLYEEGKLD